MLLCMLRYGLLEEKQTNKTTCLCQGKKSRLIMVSHGTQTPVSWVEALDTNHRTRLLLWTFWLLSTRISTGGWVLHFPVIVIIIGKLLYDSSAEQQQ